MLQTFALPWLDKTSVTTNCHTQLSSSNNNYNNMKQTCHPLSSTGMAANKWALGPLTPSKIGHKQETHQHKQPIWNPVTPTQPTPNAPQPQITKRKLDTNIKMVDNTDKSLYMIGSNHTYQIELTTATHTVLQTKWTSTPTTKHQERNANTHNSADITNNQ